MRLFLQNPNGINKSSDPDNLVAMQDIADWKVDILGLPETNVNWTDKNEVDRWKQIVRKQWPRARVLTASNQLISHTHRYNPGGVSMVIQDRLAAHITKSGADTLGRWVWATI